MISIPMSPTESPFCPGGDLAASCTEGGRFGGGQILDQIQGVT